MGHTAGTLTFGRHERLKSRKQIEQLFTSGNSLSAFPLKVLYQFVPANNQPALKATVSVSKRNFKKAVDRNRIKRLLREVYRVQKIMLQQKIQATNMCLDLFFIYTGKLMPAHAELETAMNKLLTKLVAIEPSPKGSPVKEP